MSGKCFRLEDLKLAAKWWRNLMEQHCRQQGVLQRWARSGTNLHFDNTWMMSPEKLTHFEETLLEFMKSQNQLFYEKDGILILEVGRSGASLTLGRILEQCKLAYDEGVSLPMGAYMRLDPSSTTILVRADFGHNPQSMKLSEPRAILHAQRVKIR